MLKMHQQPYNATTTAATIVHHDGLNSYVVHDRHSSLYVPMGAITPQSSSTAFHAPLAEDRLNRNSLDHYLRERNDFGIAILYPKVAQRSSETQKHYFCPPPCIYPYGNGWRYHQEEMLRKGESVQGALLCAFIGDCGQNMQQLNMNDSKRCFTAETLYISPTDIRKDISLSVKMFYGNGRYIGQFNSKNIKVISKPCKRNLLQNADMYVASGTCVGLFQTLASQGHKIRRRYLHINNGSFYGSSTDWSSFQIHLINDDKPEEFQDGYVHYGATVKLVSSITGIVSPRLVVRKSVDRKISILKDKGPVLQLDKCAFYVKDTERMYLCLLNEKIIQFQAIPCPNEANKEWINDTASWTIVGIDRADYKLNRGMNPASAPLTPMPIISSLNLNGGGSDAAGAMLDVASLYTRPQVRFDTMAAETSSRCANTCRLCGVPYVTKFRGERHTCEQFQSCPANTARIQCEICKIYCHSYQHLDTHMKVHTDSQFRQKMCQIPFTQIASKEQRNIHVKIPFGVSERQQSSSGQIYNNSNSEQQRNPPLICDESNVYQNDLLDQVPTENASLSIVSALPSGTDKREQLNILEHHRSTTLEERNKGKSNLHKEVETPQSDLICEICNFRCQKKENSETHKKIHTDSNSKCKINTIPLPGTALAKPVIRYHPKLNESTCNEELEQYPNGRNKTFPNTEKQLDPALIYAECNMNQEVALDIEPSGDDRVSFAKSALTNHEISYHPDQSEECSNVELPCIAQLQQYANGKINELFPNYEEQLRTLPTYVQSDINQSSEDDSVYSEQLPFNNEEFEELIIPKYETDFVEQCEETRNICEEVLYCDKCDKSFSRMRDLQLHLTSHKNLQYSCNVRSPILSDDVDLENHTETHKFQCFTCKKHFPTLSVLHRHINEHTVSDRVFSWKECIEISQILQNQPFVKLKHLDINSIDLFSLANFERQNQNCIADDYRDTSDTYGVDIHNSEDQFNRPPSYSECNSEKNIPLNDCSEESLYDNGTPTSGNRLSQKHERRKRCTKCIGCQMKDNCGKCGPCKNDNSHKVCKARRCAELMRVKRNLLSRKKRCDECIGCEEKDNCGDCASCKNDKTHQICKQRRCEKFRNERCDQLQSEKENISASQKVSITLYQCKTCNIFCCTKESLDQHQKLHDTAFKCKYCNLRFTKESLRLHQKNVHPTIWKKRIFIRLQCDICKIICPSRQRLEQHMKIHSYGEFICKVCRIPFSKTGLALHEIRDHPEIRWNEHTLNTSENIFSKEVVQLQTESHRDQNSHKLSNGVNLKDHTKTSSFECYVCRKAFSTLSDLNIHLNKHIVYEQWVDPLSVHLSNWSPEKSREILQNQPLVILDKLDINSINFKSLSDFGQPSVVENISEDVINLASDGEDSDIEIVYETLDSYHCYFCDRAFCSLRDLGCHVQICTAQISVL